MRDVDCVGPRFKASWKTRITVAIAHLSGKLQYCVVTLYHYTMAVWSRKRKRRISTREVYKWKARLAFDRYKQIHGVNFWEMCVPVAA